MSREFKKTFFYCLMSVLLVVSNIVGAKYTNFLDVTIGVEFVTFPFTFLCTLLILNLGDKKDAYRSILVASVIQLLITISYTLVTSLGTQSLMPDEAMYVDVLFKVNETKILASILAFIVSHCVLLYLYDNFKKLGKELSGLCIGLLGAMICNSIIYLLITLADSEPIFIINMLLSNIIISVIMVLIITILFYILKEKEPKYVPIKEIKASAGSDLGIDEVVKEKKIYPKKSNVKKDSNYKKTNHNTNKKSPNKINSNKKTSNSKTKTKKSS